MKSNLVPLFIGCILIACPAWASAGDMHVYKWIDAQGITHYSDKPPAVATPDQYLMNLPKLPPVDPQKIAEINAWIASVQALQQRMRAENEKAQHERELALQQTQQQNNPQQETGPVIQTWPVYLGYARPRFFHHRHRDRDDFGHRQHTRPHGSTPTWPFPYNLNNNSSFPEEWHRQQSTGP